MKFVLEIDLGNDAMQTPQEVGDALDRLSEKFARRGNDFHPDEGGVILDNNGNTVGGWRLV